MTTNEWSNVVKPRKLLSDNDRVTVTRMNHIIEVQYLQRMNNKCMIKQLGIGKDGKKYYLDMSGKFPKVKECKIHEEKRTSHINSLYRTFKKLRYIINNNFIGADNEIMLTLTYRENMQDTERLKVDMEKFMKRFKYYCKKNLDCGVEYISVIEPQERGAFHNHCLMKLTNTKTNFIPVDDLRELWSFGSINIRSLKGIDNIGAYLTAYLTNVVEEKKEQKKDVNSGEVTSVVKKVIKKGQRLSYYPNNIKIYRKSKGILEPKREKTTYKHVKEIKELQPVFVSQKELTFGEGEELQTNTLIFEHYNLKRK